MIDCSLNDLPTCRGPHGVTNDSHLSAVCLQFCKSVLIIAPAPCPPPPPPASSPRLPYLLRFPRSRPHRALSHPVLNASRLPISPLPPPPPSSRCLRAFTLAQTSCVPRIHRDRSIAPVRVTDADPRSAINVALLRAWLLGASAQNFLVLNAWTRFDRQTDMYVPLPILTRVTRVRTRARAKVRRDSLARDNGPLALYSSFVDGHGSLWRYRCESRVHQCISEMERESSRAVRGKKKSDGAPARATRVYALARHASCASA